MMHINFSRPLIAACAASALAGALPSCRDGNQPGAASSSSSTSAVNTGTTPGTPSSDSSSATAKTQRVTIGGRDFDLEVAADPASRERGLMHRTSITEHGGMLFVFPNDQVGVQSFWMKNCLVDMDLIFLDGRGRVTAMHRMKAQPPRGAGESEADYEARMRQRMYPSGYPAQFAIELRAGWLDQLNLNVEDRIALDADRLKALAR